MSNLLRGRLGEFSVDRLLRFLNRLDQDVAIAVRPKPAAQPRATMRAYRDTAQPAPVALAAHGERDGAS